MKESETIERTWIFAMERAAEIAERHKTYTIAGEEVSEDIAAEIRAQKYNTPSLPNGRDQRPGTQDA